jgi:2-polyprenyl-3-methyl-5-hydroxy-6-metoxy-1,4-benzoquinol methylase
MSKITACKLCGKTDWRHLATLKTGVWNKDALQLKRNELTLPIGFCHVCGHTQMQVEYTVDMFSILYFSNNAAPDMWLNGSEEYSPYQQMLEHIGDDILAKCQRVADFGCGAANTLTLIKRIHPAISCYGFDFQTNNCPANIETVACDLNKLSALVDSPWQHYFELLLTTHMLEHVIDPIDYLKNLARLTVPAGHLFIEVPDCGQQALFCRLEQTNIVHGQHIHYYTADSLAYIANRAGWSVLRVRHLRNGDIPRLQMLCQLKSASDEAQSGISESAAAAVLLRFQRYDQRLSKLYRLIELRVHAQQPVGVWGVGGDYQQLIDKFPIVKQWIAQELLTLFDYDLAGFTLENVKINSSEDITHFTGTVFCLPFYQPTLSRMQSIAAANGLHNVVILD